MENHKEIIIQQKYIKTNYIFMEIIMEVHDQLIFIIWKRMDNMDKLISRIET
ncbi:unnamed protein product [Paramecium sonneborni]|uniref:Uncharacterized protein n=1 Tax=Paramecium sonneborni TaxID=65129 RepID=A0A8S1RJM7_9CILI|nr:unnamed protein product [Paramecium sonneborni]